MTVLLVEDEWLIAIDLAQALEKVGLDVMGPASSLEGAYSLVAQHGLPDAAILDIKLGGDEIYTLAEELSAGGVNVHLASGYISPDLPPNLSGLPFWPKPYFADHIARCLISANRASPPIA